MENFKGRMYLFMSFALAGTAVIAARFITSLGTFTITASSLLLAIVLSIPFYGIETKKSLNSMKKSDWIMISLQAFFGIFLFRAFLLYGLQHTSSAEAGILIGCAPVITCILASFILNEKADRKTIAGILFAVAGIFLLQGKQFLSLSLLNLLGNALVLCAAVSESAFNILSRIHSARKTPGNTDKLDPVVQSLLVSVIAFVFCLIPALFEHPVSSLMLLDARGWLSITWYGLIVTMLSYVLWYAGIKRCSAYTAAAFSSLMPLTSMLLSFLILKENISGIQWLGGSMVVLGILFIVPKNGVTDTTSCS